MLVFLQAATYFSFASAELPELHCTMAGAQEVRKQPLEGVRVYSEGEALHHLWMLPEGKFKGSTNKIKKLILKETQR